MQEGRRDHIPILEWFIGIIGLALVLSSVSFLLYRSLVAEAAPAGIEVRLVQSVRTEQGYLATVMLKNTGGKSVASVRVVGVLRDGNSTPLERQFVLDYLPAKSTREILMLFPTPPSVANLVFSIHSFEES